MNASIVHDTDSFHSVFVWRTQLTHANFPFFFLHHETTTQLAATIVKWSLRHCTITFRSLDWVTFLLSLPTLLDNNLFSYVLGRDIYLPLLEKCECETIFQSVEMMITTSEISGAVSKRWANESASQRVANVKMKIIKVEVLWIMKNIWCRHRFRRGIGWLNVLIIFTYRLHCDWPIALKTSGEVHSQCSKNKCWHEF